MVGDQLRQVRLSRGLSLTDVAVKAHISAATLSRIENNKQGLDLGLFLTLSRILKVAPAELLGSAEERSDPDPLVQRIASLSSDDRAHLWRDLASARRSNQTRRKRSRSANIAQQVEELIAQFEFIREELDDVRVQVRRR